MTRSILTAAAAVAAMLSVAAPLAAEPALGVAAAQDGTPPATAVVPVNGRISGTGWDVEVNGLFTGPSPTRYGYTEVRVAITMRNTGPDPLPYSQTGFQDSDLYPALAIRDAAGTVHDYKVRRPLLEAVGSSLVTIPVGMTARWTVGFQVPTVNDDAMTLLVADGVSGAVTGVDLTTQQDAAGWPAPAGTKQIEFGTPMPWGGLEVTPTEVGTRICGDPTFEHVTQVVAVAFVVVNATESDQTWPGVRFPDLPAVAAWSDGTSARFVRDTFVGSDDPLYRWADDAVVIPPRGVVARRALVFAAARDGRMGPVADGPHGVLLQPPDGGPVWLTLPPEATLALGPAYCDPGTFDFTLPHAFAPGPLYQVGPAGARVDAADADRRARRLLTDALVVTRSYADAQGSYLGVGAVLLEGIWSGVDFVDGFGAGGVGFVGVAGDGSGSVAIATRSAGGTWFCARDDLDPLTTSFGEADSIGELEDECLAVTDEA